MSVCLAAHEIVDGEKATLYGEPCANMDRVASLWSAYLGHSLTGHDVAMLMVLLKAAREKHTHSEEHLVDLCGYAEIAGRWAARDRLTLEGPSMTRPYKIVKVGYGYSAVPTEGGDVGRDQD